MTMIIDSKPLSPASAAISWLDRRLAAVIEAAHRRSRRRITALTFAIALIAGAGTLWYATATGLAPVGSALRVAALATMVSLLTAAALYPVLRMRNGWLLQATSTISRDNIDLLAVLGKLTELRHGETAGHNTRVTAYTLLFAEALGFSAGEIVRAVKGALLHDVGKLAVPDRILHKPGPLNADERAEMKRHVGYGLDIVSQSSSLREAAPVVAAHHEHYDGRGYPLGLKAEEIPREARLFALIDVFDALTSQRSYKPAYSVTEALETMAGERGSHFDPVMFDRFSQWVPICVQQLPGDEPGLTNLLMDRLLPYLDHIVPLGPDPGGHAVCHPAAH